LILNLKLIDNLYPINECNLECNCDELKCSNRLVQHGVRFKMESFHTECRGIGLRTLDYIQAGSFVIEYLGELIGLKHAELLIEQREKNNEPNYIMFLREHFNHNKINTYVIDAKNYSNKARFINHSCEPNLGRFFNYLLFGLVLKSKMCAWMGTRSYKLNLI
jgi:SET domain-containing protein